MRFIKVRIAHHDPQFQTERYFPIVRIREFCPVLEAARKANPTAASYLELSDGCEGHTWVYVQESCEEILAQINARSRP